MRLAHTNSAQGITLLTLGLFMFSLQDVIIKSIIGNYPVLQIMFYRSITGICIMLAVLWMLYPKTARKPYRIWPIMAKAGCAFISYTTYYLAIAVLPLAEAATITFSAPIMVTVMSVLLFKEHVGARRWAGVLCGFLAIVLVVGPQGRFNNPAVLLALTAALSYAGQTILTRYIDPRDGAVTIATYTIVVFLAGSLVCSLAIYWAVPASMMLADSTFAFLLRPWSQPGHLHQWGLVALGLIAAIGFFCLVKAYMVAEFSAVAPFEYTYLIWSVLFGYIFWHEVPSATTLAGIVLLVASNLYILHRELRPRGGQRRRAR